MGMKKRPARESPSFLFGSNRLQHKSHPAATGTLGHPRCPTGHLATRTRCSIYLPPFVTYRKFRFTGRMGSLVSQRRNCRTTKSYKIPRRALRVQKVSVRMTRLGSPLRLSYRFLLLALAFSLRALAVSPNSVSIPTFNFGNVQVGSSVIMPITITNSSKTSATYNQVTISAAGFTFVGPTLPIVVPARQKTQFSVMFAPQTAGNFTAVGTAYYVTTVGGHSYNGSVNANLSGTGTASGFLSAPSSMSFGSVTVGNSQSQTLTISNSGGSNVTISGASVTGAGFSVTGLSFPYTLSPGASASMSVTFAPTNSGAASATLTLASNASNPTVNVSLSGTGSALVGTISVSPGSLSFGSVTIGSTQTQNGSVTASGGTVTLSSTSSSNSLFTVSGLSLPVTLSAGQSVPFTVTFAPTTTGTASASLTFASSNSNSVAESASGSGATLQHIVDLSWNASTSGSVSGYNVYRSTSVSGPYSKINPALDSSLSYSDGTVQSGKTYYYATTAVDSSGQESSYSNQIQTVVPFP